MGSRTALVLISTIKDRSSFSWNDLGNTSSFAFSSMPIYNEIVNHWSTTPCFPTEGAVPVKSRFLLCFCWCIKTAFAEEMYVKDPINHGFSSDNFDPFIVGSDHRRNQEMLRKVTSLGEDFTLDWLIAEPREVTMRNLHIIIKRWYELCN